MYQRRGQSGAMNVRNSLVKGYLIGNQFLYIQYRKSETDSKTRMRKVAGTTGEKMGM
jgi:hypothetical protein